MDTKTKDAAHPQHACYETIANLKCKAQRPLTDLRPILHKLTF